MARKSSLHRASHKVGASSSDETSWLLLCVKSSLSVEAFNFMNINKIATSHVFCNLIGPHDFMLRAQVDDAIESSSIQCSKAVGLCTQAEQWEYTEDLLVIQ